MLRALSVATLVLLGLLVLAMFRLDAVGARAASMTQQLETMRATLEGVNRQLELSGDRFTLLDQSIAGLRGEVELNQQHLQVRIARLQTITRQKGDTDESWKCLDAPVPAGLDQWLRNAEPEAAGGDGRPAGVPAGQLPAPLSGRYLDGWKLPGPGSLLRSPWPGDRRLQRAIVSSSAFSGKNEGSGGA